MKKLLLSSLVATSIFAFAYTQTDVDNATYLAGKGIITSQSTVAGYRLDDTITRAEVIGIALKMRGIVLPNYQCKGYYTDTRDNNWICRAVELAADNGIISRANTKARPQDSITRAEALSILMKTSKIDDLNEAQILEMNKYGFYFDSIDGIVWQTDLLKKALYYSIIKPKLENGLGGTVNVYFYPNQSATRAEVFEFAKNILAYKEPTSGNNLFSIKDGKLYKNNQVLLENIDGQNLVDYVKFCKTVEVGTFTSLIKIYDVDKQFLAASIYQGACGGGIGSSTIIIDTETLQFKNIYDYVNKNYPNNQLQLTDLSNGKISLNIFGGDGIFDLNAVASEFNQDKKSYEEDNIYFQESISLPIEDFLKN